MFPQRLLPLCAALLAFPVLADDLFFADLPVVASVSRLPQRIADAPASVTVIDREMIRASGVRSLNDIFRLVPGFQTFAHSDAVSRVTYHGLTDDNDYSPRVQVLIDGRSLHSPLFRGGVNWGLLPVAIDDIERIEVLRGSNSVSYGTNAFLGVVNIITVDPSLVQGGSISVNRGTQGVADHTLRFGGRFGESGNFRLTYQEVKDDGLEDNYDWSDSYRNRRLDFRFDQQLTASDLIELNVGQAQGRFTRGRYGCDDKLDPAPCGPSYGSDAGNPIRPLSESSSWFQARWLRTLSEGEDFSLRYSYSEDKGNESFIDTDRAVGLQKVDEGGDRGRRHELEVTHYLSPRTDLRLVWGGSWRYDSFASDSMMRSRGEQSRQVWRGFSNGEWKPVGWLTANLGFASEHDSLAGVHYSPRASLAYHFSSQDTLRLGVSRSWRTSSILAYKANYIRDVVPHRNDQIANRHLPAERLDTLELAYLGNWSNLRMSLDVRHFDERITDRLMVIRPGPRSDPVTQRSEQSIQDIRIRGYEFQWKWEPVVGTKMLMNHTRIRLASEWSKIGDRIAQIDESNLWDGQDIIDLANNSAPRRSSSLMFMQQLPYNLQFSAAYYRVGAMKWTRNTDVDGYRRVDARLGYPFKIGGKRGEIAYVVQSLNGAHVEQRDRDDEPKQRTVDRRHWVSLRLDF